jgi:plasmid stabilization system protein ParE
MKVRYSPRALGDIERISEYLAERSPSGAQHVLEDIYAAIEFIANQPEASESTDNPTIRVKIVLRYRYKIFYRVSNDSVDIVHVRHTSRRPWQRGQQ